MTAMISAARRARMMPSLSVVQTVPSLRRKEAPALSSPPKPTEPSTSPGTNHLKPTGTSQSTRPKPSATKLIMELDTRVLPMRASCRQPGRLANKYSMATAKKWLGFISPASGVTMPWRSASASFPVSTSKSPRLEMREAIALGLEGSIRIFSSQSKVINDQAGSTLGFTTVRLRL